MQTWHDKVQYSEQTREHAPRQSTTHELRLEGQQSRQSRQQHSVAGSANLPSRAQARQSTSASNSQSLLTPPTCRRFPGQSDGNTALKGHL